MNTKTYTANLKENIDKRVGKIKEEKEKLENLLKEAEKNPNSNTIKTKIEIQKKYIHTLEHQLEIFIDLKKRLETTELSQEKIEIWHKIAELNKFKLKNEDNSFNIENTKKTLEKIKEIKSQSSKILQANPELDSILNEMEKSCQTILNEN
tara:strand:+ start:329 stop:781 length:453 start_codon:yes stop_codon:yes gene_type:complete